MAVAGVHGEEELGVQPVAIVPQAPPVVIVLQALPVVQAQELPTAVAVEPPVGAVLEEEKDKSNYGMY